MTYVVFAVVFVLPFLDPRRPFRVLHLDLLVLALFPLYFLRYMDTSLGEVRWAVVFTSIGLAYVLGRMVVIGFQRQHVPQRLVPIVPVRALALATVLLLVVHVAFPRLERPLGLSYRPVIDVGIASALGARQILHGREVYGERAYRPSVARTHPDTYGPAMYLAYVPFVYAAGDDPYRGARAAAEAFDVLVAIGMFLLGRRLAGGQAGTRLGVALSYAWAAYPCSFFATIWAYNDALVSLLVVAALLAATAPARAGFLVGLAAAAKVAAFIVAPLFATARAHANARSTAAYAASVVLAVAAVTIPFVPHGGVHELYDRTLGWQLKRGTDLSIWGQVPALHRFLVPVRALAVLFAFAVAFVPRRKSLQPVAAFGAASIIAFELALNHLLPSYVLWFLPLSLVALLGRGSESTSSSVGSGSSTASKPRVRVARRIGGMPA